MTLSLEDASLEDALSNAGCCCRLILLDAFALLYRAHFGLKDVRLATTTGEDTSILFAFLRTLLGLLELEPPPTHFAVVFDAAGKTFRSDRNMLKQFASCHLVVAGVQQLH